MNGQVAPVLACPCAQELLPQSSDETSAHRCCNALPFPSNAADEYGQNRWLIPVRSAGELTPDCGACADSDFFLGASIDELKEPRYSFASLSPPTSPRLISQRSLRSCLGRAPPF